MFKPKYTRQPFHLDSYLSAWESDYRNKKDSWIEVGFKLSEPQERYRDIVRLKK